MSPRTLDMMALVAAFVLPAEAWAQDAPVPFASIEQFSNDSVTVGSSPIETDSLVLRRSASSDSVAAPDKKKVPTHGSIEVGGIYGSLPFTSMDASPLNAYARGSMGLDLLGVPIAVAFDLGTDHLQRGQRNSVRLVFDAPKVLEEQKWSDAAQLHESTMRLDSLKSEQSNLTRRVLGQEAIWTALENIPDHLPQLGGTDSLGLLPNHSQALDTTVLPAILEEGIGWSPTGQYRDSLETLLAENRSHLQQLDTLIAQQSIQVARLHAVVNATQGKDGLISQLARGIRRLELGTCSPSSSEFLINGVNFQGVSMEFAHRDFYLSLDRGRSFDDSWQNADPVARDMRRLHQSLFLTDVQDLNPKKLTAVRTGFGLPTGTHVHVGYLNGSREDIPPGLAGNTTTPGISTTNHVLELDLGYSVMQNHMLRVVYARSIVQGGISLDEDSASPSKISDLFTTTGDQDEAVKLGWVSELPKTRTHLELEGRLTDPFFQSYGVGFIRNGSKAGELRIDQHIGSRFRLRVRGVLEERQLPSTDTPGNMVMQRGHVSFNYRASRALSLRGSVSPVHLSTSTSDHMNKTTNGSYTLGGDLRKRWRSTVFRMNVDGGLYNWSGTGGRSELVLNQTVGLGVERGDRWRFHSSWTGMRNLAVDTVPSSENISCQVVYRSKRSLTVEGGLQLPTGYRMGWSVAARHAIGKRLTLHVRGERYSRTDIFFSDDRTYQHISAYTWTTAIQFQW